MIATVIAVQETRRLCRSEEGRDGGRAGAEQEQEQELLFPPV